MPERIPYFEDDFLDKKDSDKEEVADHVILPEMESERDREKREKDAEIDKKMEKILKQPSISKEARKGSKWKRVTAAVGLATALHGVALDQYAGGVVEQEIKRKAQQVSNRMTQFDWKGSQSDSSGDGIEDVIDKDKEYKDEKYGIEGLHFTRNIDGSVEIREGETEKINWKRFFLADEADKGIISVKEAQEIEKFIAQDALRFKDMIPSSLTSEDKLDFDDYKLRAIHAMAQDRGRGANTPKEQQQYLSGIVRNKVGDCKARNKRAIAYLHEMLPYNKVKIQMVVQNNEPHIRPIIQIGNKWYGIENTIFPLNNQDLEGSIIVEATNYLRGRLGTQPEARLLAQHDVPHQKLDLVSKAADDGFDLLPPGIDIARTLHNHEFSVSDEQLLEQPTSFEQAQVHYQKIHEEEQTEANKDFEVKYVEVEDLKYNSSKEKKESEVKKLHLSDEEVMAVKIEGELNFTNLNTAIEGYDPDQGTSTYKHFKELPHAQKIKIVEQSVLDLSPVSDVPVEKIILKGVYADIKQLHSLEKLKNFEASGSVVRGIENLQGAPRLEKFSWDGEYYPLTDQSIIEDVEQALRGKESLTGVFLNNFPFKNIDFLRGLHLKNLTLSNTSVTSLSPVKDQPLEKLGIGQMSIRDFSEFKDRIDKKQLGVSGWCKRGSETFDNKTYQMEVDDATLDAFINEEDRQQSIKKAEQEDFKPDYNYDRKFNF